MRVEKGELCAHSSMQVIGGAAPASQAPACLLMVGQHDVARQQLLQRRCVVLPPACTRKCGEGWAVANRGSAVQRCAVMQPAPALAPLG